MHVYSLYGYILTRVYCQIPDSKGVKRFHPSGRPYLLASGQINGKIKTRKKYIPGKGMAVPKILVSSFIHIRQLSFCDFICS